MARGPETGMAVARVLGSRIGCGGSPDDTGRYAPVSLICIWVTHHESRKSISTQPGAVCCWPGPAGICLEDRHGGYVPQPEAPGSLRGSSSSQREPSRSGPTPKSAHMSRRDSLLRTPPPKFLLLLSPPPLPPAVAAAAAAATAATSAAAAAAATATAAAAAASICIVIG